MLKKLETACRWLNVLWSRVGTRVLVDKSGRPNQRRIDALACDLAALHRKGVDVVLVSSGAVGAGMEALRMKIRPKTLPELQQMAAAVGQARLMSRYEEPFAREQVSDWSDSADLQRFEQPGTPSEHKKYHE